MVAVEKRLLLDLQFIQVGGAPPPPPATPAPRGGFGWPPEAQYAVILFLLGIFTEEDLAAILAQT